MKQMNNLKYFKKLLLTKFIISVATILIINLSIIKLGFAEENKNDAINKEIQNNKLSKGEQINERLKNLINVCNGIRNFYECVKAIEDQEIKKYSNLVSRNNNILSLKLDNGKYKKLEDITKENFNDNTQYYFQTYIPEINCYLISGNYGGGFYSSDFLVKKEDGNILMLSSDLWYKTYPVFNNNVTRIFSFNCDMDGNSNGMIIYSYNNNYFTKEYNSQKGIKEFYIINDNFVTFKACSYSANKDEIKYLKFDGKEWNEETNININNEK